jgi:YD repeat-containing protein
MPNTGTEQEFNYQFNTIGMVTDFQNDNQNINISYPDPTDDNSLLPTNIDVNGLDINYSYDDRGNVKSTQIENNEDEDFWYDANNNLIQYRDSNNNDTYFNYDGNSNLMSIEDALGNFINLTYDSFGQVLSITNQEGITVNYTYEDDGAVSTIIAPENLTSSFSYDGINRLLSQTINGQTSSFIYDPNDNLTSQTNIGGLTTTFNYDGNDNLVTITNANGVNTSFTYNNEDQVTSETFNSLIKQYQYNDDGSLKKYTKPSGQEIEYDYLSNGKFNGAGTITDVDYFGSSGGKKEGLISHIYNANGHYEFNYDELNRLISVDDTFDNINDDIDYEYDDVGNLTRLSYPGTSHSLKYNYDAKNRLILVN